MWVVVYLAVFAEQVLQVGLLSLVGKAVNEQVVSGVDRLIDLSGVSGYGRTVVERKKKKWLVSRENKSVERYSQYGRDELSSRIERKNNKKKGCDHRHDPIVHQSGSQVLKNNHKKEKGRDSTKIHAYARSPSNKERAVRSSPSNRRNNRTPIVKHHPNHKEQRCLVSSGGVGSSRWSIGCMYVFLCAYVCCVQVTVGRLHPSGVKSGLTYVARVGERLLGRGDLDRELAGLSARARCSVSV